jgi:mono/diheme cytochrome c family protein
MRSQVHIPLMAVFGLVASSGVANAQSVTRFTEQGGEAIFKGICQGCHMPDGRGALGAGRYPALARDPNLAGRGYPLVIVINGQKAMPAFGELLSDRQIADVVNYIRSRFGNHFTDEVTVSEVKAVRPRPDRGDLIK